MEFYVSVFLLLLFGRNELVSELLGVVVPGGFSNSPGARDAPGFWMARPRRAEAVRAAQCVPAAT